MSDEMQQYLGEVCEWMYLHGKHAAAEELAQMIENEDEA